jgi:hypothetical protein
MKYGTGTITAMRRGKSIRYRVRIPDGHGKYESLGVYDSFEEAERMRAAGLVAAADATTLGGIDLYSYGERYIDRCGLRDVRTMRSRWKTIVANAPFVRTPLAAITRNDVRDWARSVKGPRVDPCCWQERGVSLRRVVRSRGEAPSTRSRS